MALSDGKATSKDLLDDFDFSDIGSLGSLFGGDDGSGNATIDDPTDGGLFTNPNATNPGGSGGVNNLFAPNTDQNNYAIPGTTDPNNPGGADGTGGSMGQNGINIGGANGGVTVGTSDPNSGDTNNGASLGGPTLAPSPVTTTFGGGTGAPGAIGNPNLGVSGSAPPLSNGMPSSTPGVRTSVSPGSTLGSGLGSVLSNLTSAGGLASLLSALNQENNAGNYQNWANQAAATANPFGQYRQQYGDQLAALEANPSSVANTPGYQFALQQGLNSVSNTDNKNEGVGAGSTDVDRMNYSSGLAQQTYNNTVSQLSNLAGAQVGPQTAAQLQMAGMMSSANAQSGAVGTALLAALGGASSPNSGTAGQSLLPASLFAPSSTATVGDLTHAVSGAPQDTGGTPTTGVVRNDPGDPMNYLNNVDHGS